jgi:proline dehydrogenase
MTTENGGISFDNTKIAFAHYSNASLKRAYRVYQLVGNQTLSKIGATLTKLAVQVHFPIKPFLKPLIFRQFCGGETLSECMANIALLQQRNVTTNLNYGVEIKKSERDFDKTLEKNLGAIDFASRKNYVNIISCKISGLGFFSTLEKIQAGQKLSNSEQESFERMKRRLETLCDFAKKNDTKLYWDAEESWVQDVIDNLVNELMEKHNTERVVVYNTFQLYRHDRLDFLKKSHQKAQDKGYLLGAKLVRGAYMEKERERAKIYGKPSPIQPDKKATDKDFDAAVDFCLQNIEGISFCVASHNEKSSLLATQLMQQYKIDKNHPHVWFSQLYGMSEHITFNLAAHGFNSTKYMPYGPVGDVIPYLIRRSEENTSIDGQMGREISIIKKELDRRGI